MTCYHPVTRYQLASGGRFVSDPHHPDVIGSVQTPCGYCVGCIISRTRDWGVRCLHEMKMHGPTNCVFLTLTYDDEHLPEHGSLYPKHVTDFLKRLRFQVAPQKVRYFYCGEYGEDFARPHYHMILFGYAFLNDRKAWSKRQGYQTYRSAELERLWPFGFCEIGSVSYKSASYVAGYCVKKVNGVDAEGHYRRVDAETGEIYSMHPEFARMSRRPAVGAGFFEKFRSSLYPRDFVVIEGCRKPVPRGYDRMLKRVDPLRLEAIKQLRIERALDPVQVADNTERRRQDKEQCAAQLINFTRRR